LNIKIYANSLCSQPPVVGDWPIVAQGGKADSGTYITTVATSSTPFDVSIPPALLTAGADNAFAIAGADDLADTSPGLTATNISFIPTLILND